MKRRGTRFTLDLHRGQLGEERLPGREFGVAPAFEEACGPYFDEVEIMARLAPVRLFDATILLKSISNRTGRD